MMFLDWHTTLTLSVFGLMMLAIAFDIVDMALAALLGVSILTLFGVFEADDVQEVMAVAQSPLALLFGGMVVARTLVATGMFEYLGSRLLIRTKGSGKRFLLYIVPLVAIPCAFLPNATAVILIAPLVIRVAIALEVDFVGPVILTAIVSNSAGLLTLVGDPATFIVGNSIGLSFGEYLRRVSLGGLLSILTILPLLPVMFRDIWETRKDLSPDLRPEPIRRPVFTFFALLVLAFMVAMFEFGDELPFPVMPPAVAIIAASLALLLVYEAKIESVDSVLRDIDWKTLVFLAALIFMIVAVMKTGILRSLSSHFVGWFGSNLLAVAIVLVAGIGVSSSLLANIPVVAATVFLIKGYFVETQVVGELALAPGFTDWPDVTLPVFVAMMFGATLGGNATLIGASANVVGVGICQREGKPVTFMTFLRYGLPITACQLIVSAVYVAVLHLIFRA